MIRSALAKRDVNITLLFKWCSSFTLCVNFSYRKNYCFIWGMTYGDFSQWVCWWCKISEVLCPISTYWELEQVFKNSTLKCILSETALIPDEQEEREYQTLGELNRGIVNRAIKIMADRDVMQLGELMYEAEALFNNHVVLMSPENWKLQNFVQHCLIQIFYLSIFDVWW